MLALTPAIVLQVTRGEVTRMLRADALYLGLGLLLVAVGVVVSVVGFALSLVWLVIEHRTVEWVRFYEAIVRELEQKHLNVPPSIAIITSHRSSSKGCRCDDSC
jgi:Flp pilus assembly protein protease CpaA